MIKTTHAQGKWSGFILLVLVLLPISFANPVEAKQSQASKVSVSDKKADDYIQSVDVPKVVEDVFFQVFRKKNSKSEAQYWKGRARTDKATVSKLKGAMLFQKSKGGTFPGSPSSKKVINPTSSPTPTSTPTISRTFTPSIYIPRSTSRNTITIAYERFGCDYFITEGNYSYQLMEWYGGNLPTVGDVYYGDPNGYGFKDFYGETGKIHVWVDDYLLSSSRAIEKYYDKCD